MAGAGLGFQNRRSLLRDSAWWVRLPSSAAIYCDYTKVFVFVELGEWKGTNFSVEICSVIDFVCGMKTEVSISVSFH